MAVEQVDIVSTAQNGWKLRFVGEYNQSTKTLTGKFQAMSMNEDTGLGQFYVYDNGDSNAGFLINGVQVFSFGTLSTNPKSVYFGAYETWADISDAQVTVSNAAPVGIIRFLATMRWQGTGTIRPLDYSESYAWINSAQQIFTGENFEAFKPQIFDGAEHVDVKAQIFDGQNWADY